MPPKVKGVKHARLSGFMRQFFVFGKQEAGLVSKILPRVAAACTYFCARRSCAWNRLRT